MRNKKTLEKLILFADKLDKNGLMSVATRLDKIIAEHIETLTGDTEPVEFDDLTKKEKAKVKEKLNLD